MIVWTRMVALAFPICLLWFLSEIALGRILHSADDRSTSRDKSSLRLLWMTITPSLTVGIFLGLKGVGFIGTGSLAISVAGLILILVGLIIRWIAILTLRRYFTTDVSIQEGHRLVATGIYGIIRHPAYLGSLLSFLGLGLTFSNWLSALVIIGPIFLAFRYRIMVEEQVLVDHFGAAYDQYRRRTKRLIPKIY